MQEHVKRHFGGGINVSFTSRHAYPPPRKQAFLNPLGNLSISLFLALAVFVPQMMQPQAAVFAATTQSTPNPNSNQIGNGPMAPPHQTAQDIAFDDEKQGLAREFAGLVLPGKEPLSTFEQHMTAFMQKHNLGNVANLHNVLTTGLSKKAAFVAAQTATHTASVVSPNSCPNVATSVNVVPNTQCPVDAAQFPEERSSYCSDATVSTAVVEDSFVWGGNTLRYTNTHGVTYVLSYNAYQVTQPAATALNDEDMLANNILNNPYPAGAGPDQVRAALNDFVNGNGGNYNEVLYGNVASNFQNDLVSDINTGWDLAGGLYIYDGQGYATLPGYSGHGNFDHWIPITFYTNNGATTYYSDPIYAAPNYSGWAVPPPYETTSTSNITTILSRLGYIW